MKINCVSCGHTIYLDDAYDDFEGPVKCYVCGGLLQIKTEEGKLKSIRLAPLETPYHPVKEYSGHSKATGKQM
jgi:DNA-directed RNA polymerase subunit N (RpoN/RPB10)